MVFKVKGYTFHLAFFDETQAPKKLSLLLLKTAQSTLKEIPSALLNKLLKRGVPYLLSLSLVHSHRMRRINKQYRGKAKSTDVLSFSRLEGKPMPFPEIGEVILCENVAKRQAKKLGHTYSQELGTLTIHGVLHLFGYDHELSKKEEKKMFTLQNKIAKKLKLPLVVEV